MSSSPDSFRNSFDFHEPRQELDSPFLNKEYLVEEARTAPTWRIPVPGFQLESPFLQAFEEGWGASDESEFEGFLYEEYEEELEGKNLAHFGVNDEQELEEGLLSSLEDKEAPPTWLKLFSHFIPGINNAIPLEPSKLNPGYIDLNDELILSNLQSKLKELLETKYKPGSKIRVALVDLTSSTKLKNPEYAGFRSTVMTYGASCSKVAALYAAQQLRLDLMAQARENPRFTQRQLLEAWDRLGIADRERPNLTKIFNISPRLDDLIPKTLNFSPSFQATLETVATFGHAKYNQSATTVIDLLGFPYIASILWQSGLYHPQRGGLWLGANYGGHTWKRDPMGRQSQGVNALSLATFYTLLAQDRLIDPDASQRIKGILSQPKVLFNNKGPFEKILRTKGMLQSSDKIYSKFGLWKQWFHDGALIERTLGGGTTIRYVAVILTESYDPSRRDTVLKSLLVDLDKLIQSNNSIADTQEVLLSQFKDPFSNFSDYGDGEVDTWAEWEGSFNSTEDESAINEFDEFEAELDEEGFENTETLAEFEAEEFESFDYLLEEEADPELGEFEDYFSHLYEEEIDAQNETASPTEVVFPNGESLRVVQGATGYGKEHYDPTTDPNDPDVKKRKVHLPLLPLLDVSGSNRAKQLSKDFTAGEFARSGGRQFDKARIDPKLVQCLQNLRDYLGKSITITSGYRPYAFNIDIYQRRGKKPTKSQHTSGRGVDVNISGMSGLEIAKAAIDVCGCDIGVGIGYTFAHIDVRGEFVTWTYIQANSKKDHAKAIQEITAYRNQKCQGKPSPGRQTPDTAKLPAGLVKFAQQVLSAAEGDRLAEDDDLGRLTRAALERFRKKYSLGSGNVIDNKTQLALAQRALEEIAQQSIFPQLGMLDAKTEQALIAFKSKRGLGFNATLDAATRVALTDALAKRIGTAKPTVPSATPTGFPKLGKSFTPPSDPTAYRRFRLTTYHVASEPITSSDPLVPVLTRSGNVIANVPAGFFAEMALEGRGKLKDGRLLTGDGWRSSTTHNYSSVLAIHHRRFPKGNKYHDKTKVSGITVADDKVMTVRAYAVVPKTQAGQGYGVLRGIPLEPYRTLAADIGAFKNSDDRYRGAWSNQESRYIVVNGKTGLVPTGTQVYIRQLDGVILPNGKQHDGWVIVNDTGGGIFGAHFDVFVGEKQKGEPFMKLVGDKLVDIWFNGIEQRIPPGYTYGLT